MTRTAIPLGQSFRVDTSESNVAPSDSRTSQWYNACSSGGTLRYPYGASFDSERCGKGAKGTTDECAARRGNGTVFGLSGSVQEWEDICSDEGTCALRGGARHDVAESLACDAVVPELRTSKAGWVGFRCCLDLEEET